MGISSYLRNYKLLHYYALMKKPEPFINDFSKPKKVVEAEIEERKKIGNTRKLMYTIIGLLVVLVLYTVFYYISLFYDNYKVTFYEPIKLHVPFTIYER